ncbi:MAG: hypothetical protein ACTHM7_21605 [Ginsengibacter sp.]
MNKTLETILNMMLKAKEELLDDFLSEPERTGWAFTLFLTNPCRIKILRSPT